MKRRLVLLSFLLFVPSLEALPGLYVQGRHLYDACGERIILRGVNHAVVWVDRDAEKMGEIAKTGANSVRIVWETNNPWTPFDRFENAIQRCLAEGMIPIVELHDATGAHLSAVARLVDYWIRPDVREILQRYEKHIIVNIGNEVGGGGNFRAAYSNAVFRMRQAGLHMPLMIDANDWGKNIDILQAEGHRLTAIDPDANLLFSVHTWWPYVWGWTGEKIREEFAQSVSLGIPLVVGEFGNKWGTNENEKIPYLTILTQCHLHGIGWLAWSWGPNNYPQTFLDMTSDGNYDTLHDWGLEVAVTHPYGIRKTSLRSPALLFNACAADWRIVDFFHYFSGPDGHPEAVLQWTIPGADAFVLLRGEEEGFFSVTNQMGSRTVWTDRTLQPGEVWYYRLLAYTNSAVASVSPLLRVEVPWVTIRGIRMEKSVSQTGTEYTLHWNDVDESDAVYRVLESSSVAGPWRTNGFQSEPFRKVEAFHGRTRRYRILGYTNGRQFASSVLYSYSYDLPGGSFEIRGNYVRPGDPGPEFFVHLLSEETEVTLRIYDAAGVLVRTLAQEPAGRVVFVTRWNLLDDRGRTVPSGTYLAVARADGRNYRGLVIVIR